MGGHRIWLPVDEVARRHAAGDPVLLLAAEYGVTKETIRNRMHEVSQPLHRHRYVAAAVVREVAAQMAAVTVTPGFWAAVEPPPEQPAEQVTTSRLYRGFVMQRVEQAGHFTWRTYCAIEDDCLWRRHAGGPAGLRPEIDAHVLDHNRQED